MSSKEHVVVSCDACGMKLRLATNLQPLLTHTRSSEAYWLCRQTKIVIRGGCIFASRYTKVGDVPLTYEEMHASDLRTIERLTWWPEKMEVV